MTTKLPSDHAAGEDARVSRRTNTILSALRTLGQDEPSWLGQVDRLLGGVLHGDVGEATSSGAVTGWINPVAPVSPLIHDMVKTTAGRVSRTSGFERLELVHAMHSMTVVTAFFDVVRDVVVHVPSAPSRSEEEPWAELDVFVFNFYRAEIPAPAAVLDFPDMVANVEKWAFDRAERVRRLLGDNPRWTNVDALLEPAFSESVAAGYRAAFESLAADVPEFVMWAVIGKYATTAAPLDVLLALLSGNEARLPDGEVLRTLKAVNEASLERPIIDPVMIDGAAPPHVRDIYVEPHYRIAVAGPGTRLAYDGWWHSEAEARPNLALALARHFTGPECVAVTMLVLGPPGSGKSMLSEILAARLPSQDFTVVRVPLRVVAPHASVVEQIEQGLAHLTGRRISWAELDRAAAGRVRVLVLDGLDELMQASGGHRDYLTTIADFQQREAEIGRPLAVVVTSRTSVMDRVVIPNGAPLVRLEEFDDAQIRQWIDAWNRVSDPSTRRPMSVELALSQNSLARRPLGLLTLTLSTTDPGTPPPDSTWSTTRLIRHQVHSFVQREVRKASHPWATAGETYHAYMQALGVVALGMFNRGRQSITAGEFDEDARALGFAAPLGAMPLVLLVQSAQIGEGDVRRAYEWQHAMFGEYLIATFVLDLLWVTADERTGRVNEALLFALLSHQLLAMREPVLEFVRELADVFSAEEREQAVRALDALIRHHDSQRDSSYREYRPTSADPVGGLACYTVNLVLLRLRIDPSVDEKVAAFWRAEDLIPIWKSLPPDSFRSVLSLLSIDDGIITSRRLTEVVPTSVEGPAGVSFVRRGLSMGEQIGQVTWSFDGSVLAAASHGRINCLRAPTGIGADQLPMRLPGFDISWHPHQLMAAVVRPAPGPPDLGYLVMLIDFSAAPPRRLCGVTNKTRTAWSPDGRKLALADDLHVRIVDALTGKDLVPARVHAGSEGPSRSGKTTWSADGAALLVEDSGHLVMLHAHDLRTEWTASRSSGLLDVHAQSARTVLIAWLTTDRNGIGIDDPADRREVAVLEGHTKEVLCARFSPDGRYLVSASADNTVRIWRCRDWHCVAVVQRTSYVGRGGIAFHPGESLVAIKDEDHLDIVRLDYEQLDAVGVRQSARQYANAKIVLVGESGVGKSGLGLVLCGKPFTATESSHGRNVWTWDRSHVTTPEGITQTREILLWDLAGQPGYRMVHQLHLNEIAVALVVFDSRSETDPFSGVRYWLRALAQARRLDGDAAVRTRVYVVAARADRGGKAVSEARLRELVASLELDGHVETSAKEGWGIDTLTGMIREGIEWEAVPVVTSSVLFDSIKDFVLEEKKQGRVLATADDLLRGFRRTRRRDAIEAELTDHFSACLGRLESRGLVHRMAFGDYVLLRPELLDAYASSLVQAAKDEPDGLGFVPERNALEGRFRMPADERLPNPRLERILLIAVVEEMLHREIALKEVTEKEVDLIFPSQFTRERPEAPDLPGHALVITFEGDLYSIYSTLAVRLSHSRLFTKEAMWHNCATYQAVDGGTCGIAIRELGEGHGELTVFFDERAVPIVRRQFEAYVDDHLRERAVADSVEVTRVRRCGNCGYRLPADLVQGKRDRGATSMNCPMCEQCAIALTDVVADVGGTVAIMNLNANAQRDKDVASTTLKGKMETGDYDVFLCHNTRDKPAVIVIAEKLKARGLLPWLDRDDIRPGDRWQQAMAKGIESSRSAAVLIGPAGQGRWHSTEMELIQDKALSNNKPVIPVVLEGVEGEPDVPDFLGLRHTVDMRVAEPDPIEQLIWGITGERGP